MLDSITKKFLKSTLTTLFLAICLIFLFFIKAGTAHAAVAITVTEDPGSTVTDIYFTIRFDPASLFGAQINIFRGHDCTGSDLLVENGRIGSGTESTYHWTNFPSNTDFSVTVNNIGSASTSNCLNGHTPSPEPIPPPPAPLSLRVEVQDNGNVDFSWGTIENWPNGSQYLLGVWPQSASGCPPSVSQVASFPRTFTSSSGGATTWNAAPAGSYKAALYTFGAPLTNCHIFSVGGGLPLPELPPGENPCHGGICNTALGNIPTDVTSFAGRVLEIAIGIAGGIALILLVFGSIRVLTSSGDQQRLAGGRDTIVAAVAGLLFLIFSVLILRALGLVVGIPFT